MVSANKKREKRKNIVNLPFLGQSRTAGEGEGEGGGGEEKLCLQSINPQWPEEAVKLGRTRSFSSCSVMLFLGPGCSSQHSSEGLAVLRPSGAEMVEAQCQRFEVRSADGEQVLFSADEEEISIGTEKLRVTGE